MERSVLGFSKGETDGECVCVCVCVCGERERETKRRQRNTERELLNQNMHRKKH